MPGRRRQKRTERSKIDATPPWESRVREEVPATDGPYDEHDAPDDGVERVDLGALRIPIGANFDIRVDLNEEQQVMSATLATADGTMQLGVFAAPRLEGIWVDVRGEIAESLNAASAGNATEHEGPFGTELHASLPAEDGKSTVPSRFIGVDGPRWFLRGMLAGPAAHDSAKSKVFEDALRGIVVVRGTDPLPVREPVPLRLPVEVEQAAAEAAEAQEAEDAEDA